MYCFQHADKGAVCLANIPILGRRGGVSVAADPAVPVIGLREVERNLQGLMIGIPPLRRGEVPLNLQRHTVGVPENINSVLTPKMKPSFWLNFVVDSMAIGTVLKLFLSFYS
jgi:hypothetical protein